LLAQLLKELLTHGGVPFGLLRIPTHAGHLFRDDVGHHSDLMPATIPI